MPSQAVAWRTLVGMSHPLAALNRGEISGKQEIFRNGQAGMIGGRGGLQLYPIERFRRLIEEAESLDTSGLIHARSPVLDLRRVAGLVPQNSFVASRSMSRATQAVELKNQPNAKPLSPDELGQMAQRLADRPSEADLAKLITQIFEGFRAGS